MFPVLPRARDKEKILSFMRNWTFDIQIPRSNAPPLSHSESVFLIPDIFFVPWFSRNFRTCITIVWHKIVIHKLTVLMTNVLPLSQINLVFDYIYHPCQTLFNEIKTCNLCLKAKWKIFFIICKLGAGALTQIKRTDGCAGMQASIW